MALVIRSLFLGLLFVLLGTGHSLWADTFYFSNPSCLVLEKNGIDWTETNAPIIPYGEGLEGTISAKRDDLVIIQRNDKVYAFPRKCLQSEEEKQNEIIIGGLPLPSYLPPPPDLILPERVTRKRTRKMVGDFIFSVFHSANSWQESFKLKSPAADYDLRATIVGFNDGVRLSYKLDPVWTIDGDLSVLYGNREVSSTTSAITYHISNGAVFGGALTPRIRFHLPNQPLITLAASTPLVLRFLDIPAPSSAYTVEEGSPFFVGFLFETRFRYRRIEITPQLGLFRELSSLAWGLEISYIF